MNWTTRSVGHTRRRVRSASDVRRGASRSAVFALTLLAIGCGDPPTPPPVTPMETESSAVVGIQDDTLYRGATDQAERIRQMADAGAAVIRADLRWDLVAPTKPAIPTDHRDPAYQWEPLDRLVQEATRNGVEVLFSVYGTPGWAADPAVTAPPGVVPWAVRPGSAETFGAFATAAARRFVPQGVRRWEAWNEPNIPLFLYPQYERSGERWVAVSPATYAALVRAFYAAVKSVEQNAIVAGGVTAPAGDRCGLACAVAESKKPPTRIRPDAFLTALGAQPVPVPMDVVSHHPYPITPPRDSTPANRSYLDLYNLDTLLTVIDSGTLRGKGVWLTEYGFGTEAADQYPLSFPPDEQARLVVDAFSRFRRSPRVRLTTYYLLRDHDGWKSGLYNTDGDPKPSRDAFALPLTRVGSGQVTVGQGVSLVGQVRPTSGVTTVELEWRAPSGGWHRLTRVPTLADGSFAVGVTPPRTIEVRGRWTGKGRSGELLSVVSLPVALRVRD